MAVVTSTGNPAVKAARRLARRAERDRTGRLLVEGPRAVQEALPALDTLFATTDADPTLVARVRAAGVDVVEVSDRVLGVIADTVTPQGLVGVAALPRPRLTDVLDAGLLVVCCWQVADPGNLGTVIRSADAAGAAGVICTAHSVDPRNAKAVRASAGSLFHLPVVADAGADEVVGACRARGVQIVAADAAGATPYTGVDFSRRTLLLLGNEAHGLPEEALAAADVVTAVPIHGRAESLNLAAAAAVLVYEAARQHALAPGGAP